MGAVCGKPGKSKQDRKKPYLDLPTDPSQNTKPRDSHNINDQKSSLPAHTLGNDQSSPHPTGPNVQSHGKEFFESSLRRPLGEEFKESFINKEGDFGTSQGNLPNFMSNVKGTLQNLDPASKGQLKPFTNEPVEKPKSMIMGTSGYSQWEQQMFTQSQMNQTSAQKDLFEPVYEDKKGGEAQDFYMEMSEKLVKEYEQFVINARQNKSRASGSQPQSQGSTTNRGQQSVLLEWSKVLQKQLSQEKSSTMGVQENKSKLQKAYRSVLALDERNWYEEMISLYKEKNQMSKNTVNMSGLTFDRKLIQLQEQFRWLISAIANSRLNSHTLVGVHEFPPFRMQAKQKKGDKLDTSVVSVVRGGTNSVTGSDDISDIFSPMRVPTTSQFSQTNTMKNQLIGGVNYTGEGNKDSYQNFYAEFPELFSSAWQEGFVWKGVYLKLYSKKEAESLKKELKALKHIGIEYLQTENSVKMTENLPSLMNPNDQSIDGGSKMGNNGQTLTTILPLLCTVESSSWILLGTPVFAVKKGISEEYATRLHNEVSNLFKNTFLLGSLGIKNFKPYNKSDESSQPVAQPHTFGNIGNTNYTSGPASNSMFLMLSNVGKTMIPLQKVHSFMVIGQEINSSVSFLEYPRKGIDVGLIKKALGYADEDIGNGSLIPGKRYPGHNLNFEVIKFKRGGWNLQMIYVTSVGHLPPTFAVNKRAMDLLANSEKKKSIVIKGNVIVFGCLSNSNTIISPYFISEQTLNTSFVETGTIEYDVQPDSGVNKNKPATRPSKFGEIGSAHKRNLSQPVDMNSFVGRESIFKNSFKYEKGVREERAVQEFFSQNVGKSLEYVIDQLENTDTVMNFEALKELFHKKGLNMRFEWIVYLKIKNKRAKDLVGADILARCLKRMFNDKTSKRLKFFGNQARLAKNDSMNQRRIMEDMVQDKIEFYLEDYFKKNLCLFINTLIKDSDMNEFQLDEDVYQDLNTDLFLNRLRMIDMAKKYLDPKTLDLFLSADTLKNLINIPCLNTNIFLDAVSYHSNLCINYEIIRQVRNDKYVHWLSSQGNMIKTTDINVLYCDKKYLTTYERCYVLLLKYNLRTCSQPSSVELQLPSSLYKLRKPTRYNDESSSYDCYLRESYELPNIEILSDWIVLLESVLNGLYTPDGQQNLLIEAYVLQMVIAFFGEGENDNQLSHNILDKINGLVNNSPVTSPELTMVINTWYGLLSESKSFAECEQSYAIALLILHKLYGDPRGRGGYGTPWELFISWRLSILSRLQGKIHDAEYTEELFDATLLTLKDNPLNLHRKDHMIYSEPFKTFESQSNISQNSKTDFSHISVQKELKTLHNKEGHPFSHWINHLGYDETSAKIDTLNATLQKTPQFLKWMMTYMPIFKKTGVLWDTAYLRDFFLSIMQSSFTNTTSVSSVSNYSMRGDRSIIGGLDVSQGIRSSTSGQRSDNKRGEKRFNPGGNLVQIFEKDASTLNKKEINGTIYSWGQNDKGQTGTFFGSLEELGMSYKKKSRMYYPKRLVLLKDTIIMSVSCGHSHSIAITLNGQLLSWGDNKFSQLGLGPNAPAEVSVPALIPGIKDVTNVSCGHAHTVALAKGGVVYSWGDGDEGLLGHGDTLMQNQPKRIDALRGLEIKSVVCGGLHTLALTKQGHLYTWGKGEGGQLGLPYEQLIHREQENHVYVMTPTRVRGALEYEVIVQVAGGDAHSMALSRNGQVFSWGYSYYGQLGLGISSESNEGAGACQVHEPTLVKKLLNVNITEVFAGATFSLFLSDRKELYGCGLNESNQLGIERNVTKINSQMDRFNTSSNTRGANESAFPKKMDCFTSMPVLQVASGEAHSLALVLCDSSYILFSWGMQKQGQLGLGDMQINNSTPRPISFLQHVMAYSMACGAYHSMVVLGDPSKNFKKELLIERLEKKPEVRWSSVYFDQKGSSYEAMIEAAINNLDNIIPSEEGRIDNPKAIKKVYK